MKREEKKQLNRKKVLVAAYELMLEKRSGKISILEISKKSKISPVSMYKYFDNKEEIFFEVYKYIIDLFIENSKIKLKSDNGDFINHLMMIHQKIFTSQNIALPTTLIQNVKDQILQDRRLNDYFRSRLEEIFSKSLTLSRQKGFIKSDISDKAIFLAFYSLFSTIDTLDTNHFDKILPEIANIFLHGISAK